MKMLMLMLVLTLTMVCVVCLFVSGGGGCTDCIHQQAVWWQLHCAPCAAGDDE
jgi:hypothetical protein